MSYEIDARETRYKGHLFRSRLEATWAAFFDELKWPWVYEPYTVASWLPDFLLLGASPVLVEVKPISDFEDEFALRTMDKISNSVKTAHESPGCSCPRECLLVGAAPITIHEQVCIGCLLDYDAELGISQGWKAAPIACWNGSEVRKKQPFIYGFCHYYGSYHDRMSGGYDGGRAGFGGNHLDPAEITGAWGAAKEATRYIYNKA